MRPNDVKLIIQASFQLEEAILESIGGESKSVHYKTLVRRVSQQLRTKEDFKQSILTAPQNMVKQIVDDFVNQRAGGAKVPSATAAQGNADMAAN